LIGVAGSAEREDLDHIQRLTLHQDDARGFNGHIRTAADGDADVGPGEGRRVLAVFRQLRD